MNALRQAWPIILLALVGAVGGMLAGRHFFDPERGPAPAAPAGIDVLEIGDRRLDLRLPDLAGIEQDIAQYDGAPLVINYWATWCPPCVEELPLLADLDARRDTDGIAVLTIALEFEPAAVSAFMDQLGLSLPIWIEKPSRKDSSVSFGNLRSVLPYSVLLDRDGKVLRRKAGKLSEGDLQEWSGLVRPQ